MTPATSPATLLPGDAQALPGFFAPPSSELLALILVGLLI